MKQIFYKSQLTEYSNKEQLNKDYALLADEALNAAKNAYAPYSLFKVGASVLLENGEVLTGNNQENAAYPSGLCAERIAVFHANAKYPEVAIRAIAITVLKEEKQIEMPVPPCGSCLQVLLETEKRYKNQIDVILFGNKKIWIGEGISQFLPINFNKSFL